MGSELLELIVLSNKLSLVHEFIRDVVFLLVCAQLYSVLLRFGWLVWCSVVSESGGLHVCTCSSCLVSSVRCVRARCDETRVMPRGCRGSVRVNWVFQAVS